MAGTVIEYLQKYGDISFREKPLNDVDSLALCQLSYLKFDGMVSDVRHNGPSVTLREIAERPDVDKLFGDVRFEKENRALFEGMLSGRRFRDMKLNCYINLVEKEWETQFSAITFILDDGTLFLAFRGTDETIVGWKEDFNMAFLSPGAGAGVQCKICKYGHRMAAPALLYRRAFQGRQSGSLQWHEMRPFCAETDPEDLQSGWAWIPAGSAEGVSL